MVSTAASPTGLKPTTEAKITSMIAAAQKLYGNGRYRDALAMCESVYSAGELERH